MTITALAPGDRATFDQLVRIYRDAIEPSEQKSTEELAKLSGDARYVFLVAREDGEVIGFAILFFPSPAAFWLLEYMAVTASRRSAGAGERLFEAAVELAARRTGGQPGILEVDQPGGGVSTSNDPERRLRFYAKLGCRRLVGLDYILPLEAAGRPPPMLLLVHGIAGQGSVATDEVRGWLRTIYAEVYGCKPDDPRIDAMLSPLRDRIELAGI